MWKKIINCIFIFFILSLIIFSAVQTYRLGKYRRELEQVRNELEYARSRTADIRETFERFNKRARGIFSESISTISDLRKQMHEVREQYENMENYINNLDSDFNNINNDNHITNGE